jgi:hypothetical protein
MAKRVRLALCVFVDIAKGEATDKLLGKAVVVEDVDSVPESEAAPQAIKAKTEVVVTSDLILFM